MKVVSSQESGIREKEINRPLVPNYYPLTTIYGVEA